MTPEEAKREIASLVFKKVMGMPQSGDIGERRCNGLLRALENEDDNIGQLMDNWGGALRLYPLGVKAVRKWRQDLNIEKDDVVTPASVCQER